MKNAILAGVVMFSLAVVVMFSLKSKSRVWVCAEEGIAWSAEVDARLNAEDATLQNILFSDMLPEADPLFGQSVKTMEMAECAARRWRLEGK